MALILGDLALLLKTALSSLIVVAVFPQKGKDLAHCTCMFHFSGYSCCKLAVAHYTITYINI